jgi:DNA transformation protein
MQKASQRPLSYLRNLGPVCQKDLNAAGIFTREQLIEIGAEGVFVRRLEAREARGISGKRCNAAYLYAIYGAIHDIDWRKIPEAKKKAFKQLAAELRQSGRFA